MNLFTWNSPYYHLLKYLLFFLKHPVYLLFFLKHPVYLLFFLKHPVRLKRLIINWNAAQLLQIFLTLHKSDVICFEVVPWHVKFKARL